MTRTAISPRLAIRIFLNIVTPENQDYQTEKPCRAGGASIVKVPLEDRVIRRSLLMRGLDGEQGLAVFDRLSVFDVDANELAGHFGLDFIHQFHRFDDAEHLSDLHDVAQLDEGRRVWRRRRVKSPHNGRLDEVQPFRSFCGRLDGSRRGFGRANRQWQARWGRRGGGRDPGRQGSGSGIHYLGGPAPDPDPETAMVPL